jgi:DNA helicase-2/ATP-dependent DNA helicase PcrA
MAIPNKTTIKLNERQREAIEHNDGPLLVVAGAGTGKTRVITERIARLLEENPRLSGENILGLTYSKKAAEEMKARVVKRAGERGRDVWLGTFHSFCLNVILKPADPELGVIETLDHWILLRRNMRELRLERYLKLHELGRFLGDFLDFFSRCQDELVTPDDYDSYVESIAERLEAERASLSPEDLQNREEEVARQREIARAYRVSERLLRERREMTFGSMTLEAERRLRNDSGLAARLSERFQHILVDEFQDTNVAQIELLRHLAGQHRNLFVVGDDDQAIYRFRGASFASFKRFAELFLIPAGRPNAHIALTDNYRSTRRILRVAGEVIAQNRDRFLPNKRLSSMTGDGERVRVVEVATPDAEAHWIADEIERLHEQGERWGAMAVLYRKHNHRDRLVRELAARRVPFVIRNLSILSNTLVRDLIAYLRLIAIPADNISFARIAAAPYWRFTPEDLARLAHRARRNHHGLAQELGNSLDLPAVDFERGGELVRKLGGLGRLARNLTAWDLVEELVNGLELQITPANADRLYLERFRQFVRDWQKKNPEGRLADFVEYLDFVFEAGVDIDLGEPEAENAVQLMTVHSAKGLEFEHVFVMRLSQRSFPSDKRRPVLEFPAELMKEARPQGDFQIQEERRLFYVALTRARTQLALTTVVSAKSKASVFLEDFLSNPQVRASDVAESAPKINLPAEHLTVGGQPANPASPALIDPARQDSRAWSRIALWALNYHPPLPEPLELSATSVDTYQTCPLKFSFEKGWGLRGGPAAAMTFGNLMHTTVQQFVAGLRKGLPMPIEELEAIYRREWPAGAYRDDYQEEEYRKAGEEQLRAFHARYVALQPRVLAQEKRFELPVSRDLVISGRIDQINRLADDASGKNLVEVVDYKTGSAKSQKHVDKNLQLSIYALAVRDAFELDPVRLVLWYLRTGERVETCRDDADLEDARQKVMEIAAQIRAGQFAPRPGFHCRNCEFQPLCPEHEQLVPIQPAGLAQPVSGEATMGASPKASGRAPEA